jgi:hypothetical protein
MPYSDMVVDKRKTPMFAGSSSEVRAYLGRNYLVRLDRSIMIHTGWNNRYETVEDYLKPIVPPQSERFDVVIDHENEQLFIGSPENAKTWLKDQLDYIAIESWRVRVGREMNTYSVHDYLLI